MSEPSEVAGPGRRIARLSQGVQAQRGLIITEVLAGITDRLPSLVDDEMVMQLLAACVEENVDTLLHMLQNDIPVERVDAPMAALEYARRLAQREVPLIDLIRGYRLGQARFLNSVLTELSSQGVSATAMAEITVQVVESTSAYIDKASVAVVDAYHLERAGWLARQDAARSNLIRRLLHGEGPSSGQVERELRYRLGGCHVGVIVWMEPEPGEPPMPSEAELVAVIGGSDRHHLQAPLIIPCDRATWWVWVPVATNEESTVGVDLGGAIAARDWSGIRLATGEPGCGLEGFLRTHRQAVAARSVALVGSPDRPRVTPFAEVGALALMSNDLDLTRSWVIEILGPLAERRHGQIRETVRTHLGAGGSLARTAEVLGIHRNSVQYRLRRAAEVRGRTWESDRLSMELALHACHWFGDRVLTDEPSADLAVP